MLPACLAALAACRAEPRADQQPAPPLDPPAFRLTEHGGRVLDLAAERGKVVVLFFGYTNCPDVCPTTLADFVTLKRRLGPRAADVRFAFITVDPRRDTPEIAQRYAGQFDPSFYGLSTDSVTIAGIQQQFRASSWIGTDSAGAVVVAHSANTYVIRRDGRLMASVRFDDSRSEALYQAVDDALRD